jgi:pimeloyl-ACP methyl ester carboxylesterase
MTQIGYRTVETNGIRMHLAEQGTGPLVVLCHGFPESWYSWRDQLPALAEAGFHAVAPDMRGYGRTDRPEAIDQYTLFHLIGDMVGLLDALGAEQAVIAGHDWGAPVAWHAALLRPDRFPGVIGLSVPFRPRGAVRPTTVMPQTDDARRPTTRFSISSISRPRAWPRPNSSTMSGGSSAPASIRSPGI